MFKWMWLTAAKNNIIRFLGDPLDPTSLAFHFRRERIRILLHEFADIDGMEVLDLGGEPGFWQAIEPKPRRVTFVNLHPIDSNFDFPSGHIVGDACDSCLLEGHRFDLVFCNSLIEHVGGHERRRRLAINIERLGAHHFVQTPYRYFPIELHWRFPGFQFLPIHTRAALALKWDAGGFTSRDSTWGNAVESVSSVDLLSLDPPIRP